MSAGPHRPEADVASETDGGVATSNVENQGSDGDRRKPTVFVLDEPVRADLFAMWLSEECRVLKAATLDEVDEEFDDSVTVALVRNEVAQELKEAVAERIASRSPFCRTVVTTSEHVEILFPGIEYDVCLTEPTTKRGVRETVSRLTRRAQYQATLKKYYSASMMAATIEVQHREKEQDPEQPHADVHETIDRLKARLEGLLETFDADDLAAIQQSIRPETRFGPETSKRNKRRGEKHRPDGCVGCGLEWGVDYGGSIGQGYRRLGAYVWKCTDCGTVQNLPDPSHRRLARR